MNIQDLVGNTPIVKISDRLYAKFETFNPSGSVKDRMALYILNKAEKSGALKHGHTIVEATSGNTGIAFSMLGALKGYKVKIIMPRNMSEERKKMMRLYGAEIIEVGDNAFKDAIALRDKLVEENDDYWKPDQFHNPDNIECHEMTTGPEIIRQVFNDEKMDIDALICGAGTGGTIMGVRKALLKVNPRLTTMLVVPEEDALSHGIQGINDGEDFLADRSLFQGVIEISTHDATERAKELARQNGLLVGISAGANILACERWIEENQPEGAVVTFLCDRGERYMTIY